MTLKIWHNPRCSKSRQTLQLLINAGHDPHIIKYLETSPTLTDIQNALTELNCQPKDILRSGEKIAKSLGISKSSPASDILNALVKNPILIERPIVFYNSKAAIGRPPEAVLELLF